MKAAPKFPSASPSPPPEAIILRRVEDATVLEAFKKLQVHRKRTPLLVEVCEHLEQGSVVVHREVVATSLKRQGLPCVTAQTLKAEYTKARQAAGLGLSDRLSIPEFSAHLREKCRIVLGRAFLARWEEWACGEAKPVFKRRVGGPENRSYIKTVTEREYGAALDALRASGIHSRAPRFAELYARVKNRCGEFGFGPSGFKRILESINQDRVAAGENPLKTHSSPARRSLNDKVERLYWSLTSREGRPPTYHEIASKLPTPHGTPAHWEVVRSAIRRINATKLPDAPVLRIQVTQNLYDVEIIRAHARVNSPHRAPLMREVYEEILRERRDASFTLSYLRDKVERLRARGEPLPTRYHEITSDMVRDAYTRAAKVLECAPSIGEVRSLVLSQNPEVQDISKSAVGAHLRLLRSPSRDSVRRARRTPSLSGLDTYPLERAPLLNRLEIIKRLSLQISNAFAPLVTRLMNRFSPAEEPPRVLYIIRSKQSKRFVSLMTKPASEWSDSLPPHELPEGGRALLKARKLLDGASPSALKTTTPALETLLRGAGRPNALTASEWSSLIAFTSQTLIPQIGLTTRRATEVQDAIPPRYLANGGGGRDIRPLLHACLKFHLRTAARAGGVSHFELLDLALQEGLRGSWRVV